ncbi:phage tail tube protein [Actinosynnema mirum]|uniref:Major tail protein n=1 Tax=Actinosynnema mirum (strain ATCC 29888 / DSM 43827 / JCM 3225 / NBRC 14064 / NCIMB 13271 / NRRL B-12336 / IMRU 3971 / 101) TaxID=446462 RepID=C6WBL5_ACTMD|nr:hypothetical protein [Actinosynnema mirum]ACU35583.1 hypothetical protein Amir_1634 [Actinosynnema mirum DSM 43827]
MTTPLKKRAVNKWRLEVDTGSSGTPTWTVVKGLTKLEPTISPTEVDTSDFDSEGWSDSLTTFRSWTVAIEGFDGFTGTDASPVDDPGQVALKAKGVLTAYEAYADVRFYRTDTKKGFSGRVSVNWSGAGGDLKGVEPFKCSLTGAGKLTPITVTTT